MQLHFLKPYYIYFSCGHTTSLYTLKRNVLLCVQNYCTVIKLDLVFIILTANTKLTCQLNPTHLMAKNDNCAQFYNCSRPNSPLGDYVDECQVGMLFHPGTKQCLPYVEVLCQGRYEPKQVCKRLVGIRYIFSTYSIKTSPRSLKLQVCVTGDLK